MFKPFCLFSATVVTRWCELTLSMRGDTPDSVKQFILWLKVQKEDVTSWINSSFPALPTPCTVQPISHNIKNNKNKTLLGPELTGSGIKKGSDLVQMCPKPRIPQRWRSLWGQRCSRSVTPGPRWWPLGRRWRRWTQRNRPNRSSSQWEGRRQTGASRRLWGNAWRSQNRRAASPHHIRLHRHHLGKTGRRSQERWSTTEPVFSLSAFSVPMWACYQSWWWWLLQTAPSNCWSQSPAPGWFSSAVCQLCSERPTKLIRSGLSISQLLISNNQVFWFHACCDQSGVTGQLQGSLSQTADVSFSNQSVWINTMRTLNSYDSSTTTSSLTCSPSTGLPISAIRLSSISFLVRASWPPSSERKVVLWCCGQTGWRNQTDRRRTYLRCWWRQRGKGGLVPEPSCRRLCLKRWTDELQVNIISQRGWENGGNRNRPLFLNSFFHTGLFVCLEAGLHRKQFNSNDIFIKGVLAWPTADEILVAKGQKFKSLNR